MSIFNSKLFNAQILNTFNFNEELNNKEDIETIATENFILNNEDPSNDKPIGQGLTPIHHCPVFITKKNTGNEPGPQGNIYTAYIRGNIKDTGEYIMLLEALAIANEQDEIHMYIESPGGMVSTGATIASAIASCEGKTVGIACGLCASAASLIWSACDECIVGDYAMFMYHMSSHMDMGNSERIRTRAEEMVNYVKNCLLVEAVKKNHITQEELTTLCETCNDVYISAADMKSRIGGIANVA